MKDILNLIALILLFPVFLLGIALYALGNTLIAVFLSWAFSGIEVEE